MNPPYDRYRVSSADAEDFSHIQALYLHVPFCRAKCVYCDFDSQPLCSTTTSAKIGSYVDALVSRVNDFGQAGALEHISTVYIGGGTPTVLGPALLRLVKAVTRWCSPLEFTCEANPESFTIDLAEDLKNCGVTRVSLGVQSFEDSELHALGRIHSAEQAAQAIRVAKSFGFDVSADLMCGIPLQTSESWDRTLSRLLSCEPDHVSIYPLSVEEGTPLDLMVCRDPSLEPDEDFQAACMIAARDRLSSAGFNRYEVASYARPGKRCRHNISYWNGASYLGIGRSASSMLRNSEFKRLSFLFGTVSLDESIGRVRLTQRDDAGSLFEVDSLHPHEAAAEDLMLACRMTNGISETLLAETVLHLSRPALVRACDRAVELGLAVWKESEKGHSIEGRRLVPTDAGWLEGNVLFELFWDLSVQSDTIE